MAEIIDIFTLPIASSQRFTVNLAVDKVALVTPGGLTYKTMESAAASSVFKAGDSFSILSAGVIIPESFTPHKDPATTTSPIIRKSIVLLGATSGETYDIDVLGFYNTINVEMENFEQSIDVFCNVINQKQQAHPTIKLSEDFSIQTAPLDINISMVGIPKAFDTKTFFISPFLKVLHNFPMLANK